MALVGLFLMATGSGGIMACDVSLGGDQFQLPQQKSKMDSFFSNFYVCINLGAFFAMLLFPRFRIHNWPTDENYVLPFVVGLTTILAASGNSYQQLIDS